MPSTAEIDRHVASGAETFTFTRAEWEAFYAHQQTYSATKLELMKPQADVERVKRIARPLLRAIARVRRNMAKAFDRCPGRAERIPRGDVEEWERILRWALDIDWHDLPAPACRVQAVEVPAAAGGLRGLRPASLIRGRVVAGGGPR